LIKKPYIKDIAAWVGVSIASVSYVLNNQYKESRVRKEVGARIRKVPKELNYQPNLIASKGLPDSFLFATNSIAIKGLKEIEKRKLFVPDDFGNSKL
jgi:DNA-binding LacI/PurR family transcriptional regulator